MLTNNGQQDGLFRGAIMQSGGPIPVGDIENGQHHFDFMVERTGCRNATNTLSCLRSVSYPTFKKAMDESPNFFAYQASIAVRCVIGLLHTTSLGTCLGVVTPCRRRLPNRASKIFRPTWPRIERTIDHRCVCDASYHVR
jgi:hypothetical protein